MPHCTTDLFAGGFASLARSLRGAPGRRPSKAGSSSVSCSRHLTAKAEGGLRNDPRFMKSDRRGRSPSGNVRPACSGAPAPFVNSDRSIRANDPETRMVQWILDGSAMRAAKRRSGEKSATRRHGTCGCRRGPVPRSSRRSVLRRSWDSSIPRPIPRRSQPCHRAFATTGAADVSVTRSCQEVEARAPARQIRTSQVLIDCRRCPTSVMT